MNITIRSVLISSAAAVAALVAPGLASAQVYVSGSASIGTSQPVYQQPAPVYVEQQPVYVQPQPVYQQPTYVQQQPAVDGHYRRLMFRVGIGGAYGSFGTSISGRAFGGSGDSIDYRVSGFGVNYTAAIGYALADNFALHVDVNGVTLFSPTLSSSSTTALTTATGQNYTTAMLGGGFSYYSMPQNIFLSGSVGLALLQVDQSSSSTTRSATYSSTSTIGQSRLGFGVNAMLGKEWFLGAGLGLGVAAQVMYALIPDQEFGGTTPLWHNVGGGLLVTLTGF